MKKIYLLIFILLLSFLTYKYIFLEKKVEPTSKVLSKQKVTDAKTVEKKVKPASKDLILTLPVERDYSKQEYIKPPAYEDNKVINQKKDFSIEADVDVDKEKKEIDGGKIQLNIKF